METIATIEELTERCLDGDRRAQFEVYNKYSKAMYNICIRMMGNREEAEDVLQNAFIDVFTKMNTFRGDSTLGAWIKRIVVNSCLNELKRRKIEFVSSDREIEIADDYFEEVSFDIDEIHRVKSAIKMLPDGYRTVFNLYLMEGYDHGEISEILGITEGASKSQYSRAKQKLYKILSQKNKAG